MAAFGWGTAGTLKQWLYAEGYRFEFFQAVRLLWLMQPKAAPPGEGQSARHEPVRFRGNFSLSFPASAVADIYPGKLPEMLVNFLTLGGPAGPLPLEFSNLILWRTRERDRSPRDFLDMFQHRLIGVAHRIRRTRRLGYHIASPEQQDFASYLMALMGLYTEGLQGRLKVPDRALLRYSGILAKNPRSLAGLTTLLSDFFGLRVTGRPYSGAWLPLDEDQWTSIGTAEGKNQALGRGAVLGTQVWDQQAGFELTVGPVNWAQYEEFVPTREGFEALCQLARFYAGPAMEIQVKIVVHTQEIRSSCLDSGGGPRDGSLLGWTSWLGADKKAAAATVPIASVPRFRDAPELLAADGRPRG